MENANLWTRRSNNAAKLSLSVKDSDSKDGNKVDSPRSFKRAGDTSSHSKRDPFSAITPAAIKSPAAGASSAFDLGAGGAFASFGSAKTPKTPGAGTAFDFSTKDKKEKEPESAVGKPETKAPVDTSATDHPLRNSWNLYYRPPANKYSDYEKSTTKIATISTVEAFWAIYSHLKHPSALPTVSDYHIFKDGIRPVWEDEANKRGGKWIVRLKKGVADRYWEDLLLAIIGDQFLEAGDEVCGAVLSVRSGEDVLSVWTKIDGGRNIKIRETIKRILAFPPDTNIIWKSHDDSIAQRSALDEARQQKTSGAPGQDRPEALRRRTTLNDDLDRGKGKATSNVLDSNCSVFALTKDEKKKRRRQMLKSFAQGIVTSISDLFHDSHGSHDRFSPELEARIDPPPLPQRPPNNHKRKRVAAYCSVTEHERSYPSNSKRQSRRRSLMSDSPFFVPPPKNPLDKKQIPSKHVHEVGANAALYALPQQRKPRLPVEISDSFSDDVDRAITLRGSRSSSPRATNPLVRSNTRAQQRQHEQRLLPPERYTPDPDALIVADPMAKNQQFTSGKKGIPGGFQPHNTLNQSSGGPTQSRSQFISRNVRRYPVGSEPPNKKQKLDHTGTNGSTTTSSQNHRKSPSVTSIPESSSTSQLRSAVRNLNNPIARRPTSAHGSPVVNGSRPRDTAQTHAGSSHQSKRRTQSSASDAIVSPYYMAATSTNGANDRSNPETIESGSDGESGSDFTKQAAAQRRADRISTVSPTRSVQMIDTNGAGTSKTTPTHLSDSKHLFAPAESPDALQEDFEEPNTVTSGKAAALTSPKISVARQEREAKGGKRLMDFIMGDPKRGSLQREPKRPTPPPTGLEIFNLVRLAANGLQPKPDFYDFVVDKNDEKCWINITDPELSWDAEQGTLAPVKGPWRIASIINIIYSADPAPIVLLKFRGTQAGTYFQIIFEMKSEKAVVDFVKALQGIDASLNVHTRESTWLEKVFRRQGPTAVSGSYDESTGSRMAAPSGEIKEKRRRKPSATSDSDDEFTRGPGLASAAVIREKKGRQPADLKRTRDMLDPPRKPTTVISGSERSGTSNAPQISTRRTRTSTEHDQQLSSAPSEELNELTQIINGRPQRARATRRAQEREATPPRPVIKFSETVGLGAPWKKALIYPPEAKKQVEVDFGSLKRFDDDEFLNDTLINFFLRYLQYQTEVSNSRYSTKLHFFNTYFYENLTKGTKGKGINFDAVKKWTKTVNLFSRDFVVIPVNENLHWYAIIICNLSSYNRPPEEVAEEDENDQVQEVQNPDDIEDPSDTTKATRETQESFEELTIASSPARKSKGRKKKKAAPLKKYDTKKPVIITLDSLGLGRTATCRLIKDYIVALGEDNGKEIDIDELKAMTAKMIPLQSNFSDCGLYVCMYLEQFIKNPYQFVEDILQRKAEVGWPDKPDGSDLRYRMRSLIMELHRAQENEESQWTIPGLGSVMVDMKDSSKALRNFGTAVTDKEGDDGQSSPHESVQDIPELKSDLPHLTHERSVADQESERPAPGFDRLPSPPRKFKRVKTKAPEHSISNSFSTSHPPPRKLSPQRTVTSSREATAQRKELKKTEFHVIEDDSDAEPEPVRPVRGGKRPRLSTPAAPHEGSNAAQPESPQPSPAHARASPADSVTTQNLQNGMHMMRSADGATKEGDVDDRNDDDLPAWAESPAEGVDLDALEHGVDQQARSVNQEISDSSSEIPETPDADISQREMGSNTPLLPLRTKTRGPAYALPQLPPSTNALDVDPDSESYDILDEVLSLFRANTFFRNFEIKGPADRLLIYGILFVSECLGKVKPGMDARAAEKALINGALDHFAIPSDPNFPLNQAFEGPKDRQEAEVLRSYLSQVRQELAMRLHARLYEGGSAGPSKWWLSFGKRKFMGKSL
ncbi:Eukaryotic translation initiation factor 4E type 2 [Cyphellophora attinorum]|uniref:Eukaryotic translation initiation factor 4E type 2 n=1 Tax=Cyphellophora attinorum TaxID=1664694 RepID=A0A0N1HT27_9EURO|nr:Eukaryotic translation initiation factor 4E type 2 [Phialophora attinorum]KPI42000.1 Eukaryotic translation initiation factor 4E type 2 [Phialophora attinorum]